MKRRIVSLIVCVVLVASMLIVPTSAFAASKKVVQILKVTTDGARLREGPSSAYNVITSLKKGDKVFYLGPTKDSFCRIKTSTGETGYMYRGFLKSYGAVGSKQIYYCKAKSAKVYKRSGKSLKKIGKLYRNQHVIVYEVRGKWAYIKSMGGRSGYILKSALAKAG